MFPHEIERFKFESILFASLTQISNLGFWGFGVLGFWGLRVSFKISINIVNNIEMSKIMILPPQKDACGNAQAEKHSFYPPQKALAATAPTEQQRF